MVERGAVITFVVVALAIIFVGNNNFGLFSLVQEDYKTYYSFADEGVNYGDSFVLTSGGETVPVVPLSAFGYDYVCAHDVYPSDVVRLTSSKDFYGDDLRLSIYGGSGCVNNAAECRLGTQLLLNGIGVFNPVQFDPNHDSYTTFLNGRQLVEVRSSGVNASLVDVYVNGGFYKSLDLSSGTLPNSMKVSLLATFNQGLGGDSYACLESFVYKPRFSCQKGPNDLYAYESFVGGRTFSEADLRFNPKSYCKALPVIITNANGAGYNEDVLDVLSSGGVVDIPSGETWTVFYVLENDGSLPVTCEDDYYDVATGRCTNISGIVSICSEGQFDPVQGVCVVQPESVTVCDSGFRYDTNLGVCVRNLPSNSGGECEGLGGVWNASLALCVKDTLTEVKVPGSGNVVYKVVSSPFDWLSGVLTPIGTFFLGAALVLLISKNWARIRKAFKR